MLSTNYAIGDDQIDREGEDDEADTTCEDCCEEITSCTCEFTVELRQEFTCYEYTSVSVPRRDGDGEERDNEAAAEIALNEAGSGYVEWHDSDDRDYPDGTNVDDVTEEW